MSVRRPYTTCLNIKLMTKIRELAQRKTKHQNELIEEAIQDLLRKYNDQDTIKFNLQNNNQFIQQISLNHQHIV
jgi:hypothetical protein